RPGDDFVEILKSHVATADAVVVVIGPRWAELLAARKGDPNDWVYIEVRAALDARKHVIPILVGRARMPREDMLPEEIRPLARRNALELRHEHFKADCGPLLVRLKELSAERPPPAVSQSASQSARRSEVQPEGRGSRGELGERELEKPKQAAATAVGDALK